MARMIRPRRRTPTEATMGTVIEQRLDDCFKPSDAQRKYKVNLLSNYQESIQYKAITQFTLEEVKKLCPNRHLDKWWPDPEFREWLCNERETKERIEGLFTLAMEAAEDILKNTDPKAQGARAQMVRIIGELGAKFPDRRQITFVDKQVNAMDKEQLKAFIASKTPQLLPQDTQEAEIVTPKDAEV